jgi:hypothetical protein
MSQSNTQSFESNRQVGCPKCGYKTELYYMKFHQCDMYVTDD